MLSGLIFDAAAADWNKTGSSADDISMLLIAPLRLFVAAISSYGDELRTNNSHRKTIPLGL